MGRVIVIAEAGVNHNGSIDLAKQLVDIAFNAGADYVKFQTFKAESLVTQSAKQAPYQSRNIGREESQFEMLKKLELSNDMHDEIIKYCGLKGIKFLSTGFDISSVKYLQDKVDLFKVPSGELTNLPLIKMMTSLKKPMILSTGMASMEEVRFIVDEIKKAQKSFTPSQVEGLPPLTVLHCTTAYPAPFESVNLRAMNTMNKELGVDIGYSDHTLGIEVPIAAVAMGATIIEKHFTISRDLEGPDHAASLEPNELHSMVRSIRNIDTKRRII